MFVVNLEDRTIYATRGDAVYFPIEKKMGDAKYLFQPEDIVRIKVFAKKNPAKVVLCKDFVVETESTSVNIFLDRFDMKFGEIISKPVDYWWEAELNPDTYPDTFIGYNDKGPAIFKLFPEAKDVVEGEIEDPVENAAVSRMTVTFVMEYMGENAQVLIDEFFRKYIEDHPLKDGEDGVGIEYATVDSEGNLVLTYTDGNSKAVGCVIGPKGNDGKKGDNGFTFTPNVDAEGNLSWTNDGGLENPAVVNIRGADGKDGKDGSDGKDGVDGKDGSDGYTPVKGADYYTQEEQAEMVNAVRESLPTPTDIQVLKAGTVIQLNVTQDNGETESIQVTLDAYDNPMIIEQNGKTTYLTWEGFD